MLHVPGMPEGVHVSFSPEHQPVSAPAQPDRYTPPAPVGAGTPSAALTALLDAHELAYGHALCSEAYGLPDLAERRQAEEEAFRALLHTPMHSDADRVAYAIAVISRQMHSLGDGSATERDHPMAVAYRNLRFGEHAREPEEMRRVGRPAEQEPEAAADPILAAIAASRAATAACDAYSRSLPDEGLPDSADRRASLFIGEGAVMNRRPIAALSLAEIQPGQPATSKPEVTWIKPTELLVDAAYQRDLSDASLRLIRRIIERWDWRRFKPPIVAWTDDGLEVIDGQHSAIAAASHPGIDVIPVVVVEATARSDRAEAFVGHNRNRIAVTAAQMHVAAVAAGDPTAQSVARVAAAAGLTLLRLPPARAVYKPRETIAVAAVRGLISLEGEERATEILRVLTKADLGPITAAQIKAAHHLCTDPQFADLDRAGLTQTIRATPARQVDQEAKEHAAVHCVPLWRGIAAIWFKAARKKVPRTEARSPSRAAKGGITIPAWVPDDLIDDYRDVASLEGEERAASHVRKLKLEATRA